MIEKEITETRDVKFVSKGKEIYVSLMKTHTGVLVNLKKNVMHDLKLGDNILQITKNGKIRVLNASFVAGMRVLDMEDNSLRVVVD
jgi:hypothetical protein